MRRAKIIATIGPGSDAPERLDALIAAGMDVARLNSSHSGLPELESRCAAVRAAAERSGRAVAVMLDLAGPKLRVGVMARDTVLASGEPFMLVAGECEGDSSRACVNYPGLARDLRPGDRLLLDDGRLELSVTAIGDGVVETRVTTGGVLGSNKGVNVPGTTLGIDPITQRDREAIEWGIAAGVDLVAMSFVRSASDIGQLRGLLGETDVPVVAKIEKHEAIADIEAIVDATDVVMVARGDLGVETSAEAVPVLQRRIIGACRSAGVPVIVATQMLESMTSSPRPTRAEASDVANAIFDGVDAVMLSAETAVGAYPTESVATMARIIVRAEEASLGEPVGDRRSAGENGDVTQAVSAAVCDLAEDLDLAAIVTATQSGATARAVARHRVRVPIIAVTPHASVARRLQVVWGVRPLVVPLADDTDLMLGDVLRAVVEAGHARAGERVAITAGVAARAAGATDFILVREIGRDVTANPFTPSTSTSGLDD
ncbi:MAG: pyruvate kinase [Clostridiales bacterium]|nr:pyruvate kinase [Clostridiales bacterium]